MTIDSDAGEDLRAIESFAQRRAPLIEHANASGAEIDKWIATYTSSRPNMAELGRLELLLLERRNSLEALMALDDELIEYLVTHRGHAQAD